MCICHGWLFVTSRFHQFQNLLWLCNGSWGSLALKRPSAVSVRSMPGENSNVNLEFKKQLTVLFEVKVLAYMLTVLFQGAGHNTLSLLIPKISHEVLDVPNHMSSLPLTLLGVVGIPFRILVGWLADKTWVNPLFLFLLGTAGSSICCWVYPFVHAYWLMALIVGAQAAIWALYCSTFILCPFILVGLKRLDFVSGVAYGLYGIGTIIVPPAIGYIYENLLKHSTMG